MGDGAVRTEAPKQSRLCAVMGWRVRLSESSVAHVDHSALQTLHVHVSHTPVDWLTREDLNCGRPRRRGKVSRAGDLRNGFPWQQGPATGQKRRSVRKQKQVQGNDVEARGLLMLNKPRSVLR